MKWIHGLPGWGAIAAALLAGTMLMMFSASFSPKSQAAEVTPEEAAKLEFFEKKIRPILVANCHTCHSAETNSKASSPEVGEAPRLLRAMSTRAC